MSHSRTRRTRYYLPRTPTTSNRWRTCEDQSVFCRNQPWQVYLGKGRFDFGYDYAERVKEFRENGKEKVEWGRRWFSEYHSLRTNYPESLNVLEVGENKTISGGYKNRLCRTAHIIYRATHLEYRTEHPFAKCAARYSFSTARYSIGTARHTSVFLKVLHQIQPSQGFLSQDC